MSTNTRKKGERGNKKFIHQEDRLSNLPDEILVKIISCLKTREAVRSGILSTRWKFVWASVPILDIHQYDFKITGKLSYFENIKGRLINGDKKRIEARFVYFIDHVLRDRKMPCLEKIRISGDSCDPYLLRSWMRAALKRDVNGLSVQFTKFFGDSPCELTDNLFSHNKLVILKLCVDMTLNFQANLCGFPHLKVLQLDRIEYRDNDSLPNLLSSCPKLEDLAILEARGGNLDTLNLISRSVKRLKVGNYESGFLSKIIFDVPAVELLEICALRTDDFVVKDLSRLIDVNFWKIELCSFSNSHNLLRGVSNVKHLSLDCCTMETIELSRSYDFPMFKNLIRLEIDGYDSWNGVFYSKQWELLLETLKWSPMLEHLIFEAYDEDEDFQEYKDSQEYGKASDWDVPDCLVSSLNTVEFYRCSEDDVERVRYFLLNAHCLENMKISHFCRKVHSKSELCDEIFENEYGSVTVTWYKKENHHISPLIALLGQDDSASTSRSESNNSESSSSSSSNDSESPSGSESNISPNT